MAMGLTIFNTTTGCVETWNSTAWIAACAPCNTPLSAPLLTSMVLPTLAENVVKVGDYPEYRFYTAATGGEPLDASVKLAEGTPYYISTVSEMYCESSSRTLLSVIFADPKTTIPDTKGGDDWSTTKWVGAFWRDDQTGERIIAAKVTNTAETWTASVDDPDNAGSWLTLDGNGGYDSNLWGATPGDAENYQLPATRVTTVGGSGHILFRIGATSTNPATTDAAYKYPDNTIGKPPRYATVNLKIGSTDYKIFCRQGEAADFVFTTSETYGSSVARIKAVQFSPYNLTATDLPEGSPYYKDIGNVNGGIFVDYPTKAGAFFQWASTIHPLRAYHPTAAVSSSDWSDIYSIPGYWTSASDPRQNNETCPSGFRRPNDGITDNAQTTSNISVSEMRQSLYAVPKEGTTQMTETTSCAWGYYADGYFERRQITASATNRSNSAVSPATKDAAYIGTLFFNATSGASLFTPAAGYRYFSDGTLRNSGSYGRYWSSSASSTNGGWILSFYYNTQSYNYQSSDYRSNGFAVRCVSE
jgi:hypothetical protein